MEVSTRKDDTNLQIQILLSTPHGGFSETITKIEIIIIGRKVLKGYR